MSSGSDVDVLVVHVAGQRVGLPLGSVIEILPAVAVTSLPDAPPMVCGVVNLRGTPLPVLSLRERLGLDQLRPDPDHHVVVCDIVDRPVGVWVDSADAVTVVGAGDLVDASDVAASRHLAGVAVQADGLLLVYDVRSFLDADDALQLSAAMATSRPGLAP